MKKFQAREKAAPWKEGKGWELWVRRALGIRELQLANRETESEKNWEEVETTIDVSGKSQILKQMTGNEMESGERTGTAYDDSNFNYHRTW